MKKSLYRAVKRMREFSEINQEFLSETRAGMESAETTNEMEREMREMEGSFAEWEAAEVQREQQEMDIFSVDEEKMGRTIYDPSTWRENAWPENSREAWKKLGEYRIFADTSERVPRYDIFADGNGK